MTERPLGPAVAVFRIGWRRDTVSSEPITAAIREHIGGQLAASRRGESYRSGNVQAVHVLGEDATDPTLLLVSTDIGWSNRNQAAVDALSPPATTEELGHYSVVAASGTHGLGNAVRVFRLRPAPGRTAADIDDAVARHLLSLVGAPSTRAGNVLHVSLLRREHDDEHLLLVGVDIGDSPRNQERIAAVGEVAETELLGRYVEHAPVDPEHFPT